MHILGLKNELICTTELTINNGARDIALALPCKAIFNFILCHNALVLVGGLSCSLLLDLWLSNTPLTFPLEQTLHRSCFVGFFHINSSMSSKPGNHIFHVYSAKTNACGDHSTHHGSPWSACETEAHGIHSVGDCCLCQCMRKWSGRFTVTQKQIVCLSKTQTLLVAVAVTIVSPC